MPKYPGAANATLPAAADLAGLQSLSVGDYVYVWGVLAASATQLPVNDTNVAGESEQGLTPVASIAIALEPSGSNSPPMVCVEGVFGGAPGAFNVQIQEADTPADGDFITPSNAAYTITAVNSNQAFRADLSPTGGKCMRVLISSLTNNVTFRCKLTRLA